jgi:hypothetical protein
MYLARVTVLLCLALAGCAERATVEHLHPPTPTVGEDSSRTIVQASDASSANRVHGDAGDADATAAFATRVASLVPTAPEEAHRLRALILNAASADYPYPIHVMLAAGGPQAVILEPNGPVTTVVPFQTADSRRAPDGLGCGVAVFGPNGTKPELLGTGDGLYCSSMRKAAQTDLNRDGIPDFVFVDTSRSIKSELMWVMNVYVSVRGSRGVVDYCLAGDASEPLEPWGAATDRDAVRAVQATVRRLGERALQCAPYKF